jgi:hypothetical protein
MWQAYASARGVWRVACQGSQTGQNAELPHSRAVLCQDRRVTWVPVSGLEPLRDASLTSVRRAERALGWVQRQLVRLEDVLQRRQGTASPFEFEFTPERLAIIERAEATGRIWQPEDHPAR